jgi:hypothetical protein
VSVHVPVTDKGIQDVKTKMMPSKGLFTEESIYTDPDVLTLPDQDATLGIYKASRPSGKRPKRVKDIADLKRKVASGEINYNDPVVIG